MEIIYVLIAIFGATVGVMCMIMLFMLNNLPPEDREHNDSPK